MPSKKPLKRRYLTIKIWCVPCSQPTKFTAGISNDLHTVCKECETHHPNCEGCGNGDPVVSHVLGELVRGELDTIDESKEGGMFWYYKCPLNHA